MQIIRIKPDLMAFVIPGKDLYYAIWNYANAAGVHWRLFDTEDHLGYYPTLDEVIRAINDIYEEDTE